MHGRPPMFNDAQPGYETAATPHYNPPLPTRSCVSRCRAASMLQARMQVPQSGVLTAGVTSQRAQARPLAACVLKLRWRCQRGMGRPLLQAHECPARRTQRVQRAAAHLAPCLPHLSLRALHHECPRQEHAQGQVPPLRRRPARGRPEPAAGAALVPRTPPSFV